MKTSKHAPVALTTHSDMARLERPVERIRDARSTTGTQPPRARRLVLLSVAGFGLLAAGCAVLSGDDRIRVQVAGLEPLPGQGLEWRMLLKVRVQNPNEQSLSFDGIFVELNLHGQPFASGISDAKGSVPRFGETLIELPITVSALQAARQVIDWIAAGSPPDKVDYALRGKLAGTDFGTVHFESAGEINWPAFGRS